MQTYPPVMATQVAIHVPIIKFLYVAMLAADEQMIGRGTM
jgi:hypothetical protein